MSLGRMRRVAKTGFKCAESFLFAILSTKCCAVATIHQRGANGTAAAIDAQGEAWPIGLFFASNGKIFRPFCLPRTATASHSSTVGAACAEFRVLFFSANRFLSSAVFASAEPAAKGQTTPGFEKALSLDGELAGRCRADFACFQSLFQR